MPTQQQLDDANELVEWILQSINEQVLPATNRARAAASCYAIAQDHHHAIVILYRNRLYASSFALMRVMFEAYIRGLWLNHSASDLQVDAFLSAKEPPTINVLLKEIEAAPAFSEEVLSKIKAQAWSAMCSYTHTGGLHVQRWNTSDAIEPSYKEDELEVVLRLAELIALLSGIAIAELAGNSALAERMLNKMKV